MLKPIQNASSPASLGLKDEDDDDGEGEDGDGDGEKADPANVNPERLKAFNVRSLLVHRSAFYFILFVMSQNNFFTTLSAYCTYFNQSFENVKFLWCNYYVRV